MSEGDQSDRSSGLPGASGTSGPPTIQQSWLSFRKKLASESEYRVAANELCKAFAESEYDRATHFGSERLLQSMVNDRLGIFEDLESDTYAIVRPELKSGLDPLTLQMVDRTFSALESNIERLNSILSEAPYKECIPSDLAYRFQNVTEDLRGQAALNALNTVSLLPGWKTRSRTTGQGILNALEEAHEVPSKFGQYPLYKLCRSWQGDPKYDAEVTPYHDYMEKSETASWKDMQTMKTEAEKYRAEVSDTRRWIKR